MSKCEWIKCENCIHDQVCEMIGTGTMMGTCSKYKDKSLFVELPCEIGSKIYLIVEKRARHWYANTFKFIRETKLTEASAYRMSRDFGKTVFLTKEEAEARLREVSDEATT